MNVFAPPTLHGGHTWAGLRVGLLGGSFNPPHAGHLHIARLAMAKFGLDFVWWIVTPQNPLKHSADIAPYAQRFSKVQDMIAHDPRQMATHLERDLATKYTYETVCGLKHHFSNTEFLWICGMDNAHIFHKWDRWQQLVKEVPIVFIARPPAGSLVKGTALRRLSHPQSTNPPGRHTDLTIPRIYWLQGTRMVDISSTKIRNNNNL